MFHVLATARETVAQNFHIIYFPKMTTYLGEVSKPDNCYFLYGVIHLVRSEMDGSQTNEPYLTLIYPKSWEYLIANVMMVYHSDRIPQEL